MPRQFDKLGVSFQYPDNWTLDEQEVLVGRRSVTVYSPGGAFWSVSIHSRNVDPAKLAKAALNAMREEYPDLEQEEVRDTIARRETIGYDLNFCYLDLTNTACIRCLRTPRAAYVVFCQAEDREFEGVEAVFRAMTTSLLNNL